MFKCEYDFSSFSKAIDNISKAKVSKNALNKAGEELKKVSNKCFLTERSPDGKRWKPLASSTLKKNIPRTRILDINGKLRRSLKYRVTDSSVVIYTPYKYGMYHQLGYKEKNLPKRQFLGINEFAKNNIKSIFIKALKKELTK